MSADVPAETQHKSMGMNIVDALRPQNLQKVARRWFRVGLSTVAAIFALIGLALPNWSVALYPPGAAASSQNVVMIGLVANLPTIFTHGTNATIDVAATAELLRVGRVALGFGILGLILVVCAATAQTIKALGRDFDESYFIILSTSFISSLCFFCGAILYGQSVPQWGDQQRLGWSVGVYVLSGVFSFFSAVAGFND